MLIRLVRGYIICLLAAQVCLFIAVLAVHVFSLAYSNKSELGNAMFCFRIAVLLNLSSFAYANNSLYWLSQLKAAPAWMRHTALGLCGYGFVVVILKIVLPSAPSPIYDPMVVSGVPLGFIAISICFLYTALNMPWFSEIELKKRTTISLGMFCLATLVLSGILPSVIPKP